MAVLAQSRNAQRYLLEYEFVYHSTQFIVVDGVNLHEAFTIHENLQISDIYQFVDTPVHNKTNASSAWPLTGGNELYFDCAVKMMTFNGDVICMNVYKAQSLEGEISEVYLCPDRAFIPNVNYELIHAQLD